ncbi:MAG: carbohydrate porin [Bdellovibrionales bacterium]
MKSISCATALFALIVSAASSQADDAYEELMKKYAKPVAETPAEVAKKAKTVKPKKAPKATRAQAAPKPMTEAPLTAPPPVLTKAEPVNSRVPASAAAPDVAEDPPGLLGDWGGAKSSMEKVGIKVGLAYKADTMSNMSGGLKRGTAYLGNVDLETEFDFEKLVGAKGLTLVLYGLGNHGGTPSTYVGDSQVTSNIEAKSTFKLYEAYLQQAMDDRFFILLGLRDLNADYYATETSGYFINSSFGISKSISQSGVNGPSIFPTTALALNFKYNSPNAFYFQSGIFNAQAGDPAQPYGTQITNATHEGHLMIWETGWSKDECKTAIGGWTYTKESAAQDSSTDGPHRNYGYYLLFDHHLTKNLTAFVRWGIASPTVNQFEAAQEFGLGYKGLFPSRDEDFLGLGVARTQVSEAYERVNASEVSETAIELTYQFHFPRGIMIQPDIQYVMNPSVTSTTKDATVGTLRFEVEF